MELIVILGIVLICGYFFGLVAERLGFPRVTAYLLAGILFSEEFLGSKYQLNLEVWSDLFSQICLGFIAYIVGSEIHLKKLFEHKSATLLATLFSSLLPVIFVYIGFSLISLSIQMPTYLAIILAAVASTTAPAATVAVIDQYNAKGEMTDTTLKIVALDDALGVIIFVVIMAMSFSNGSDSSLIIISREIGLSSAVGAVLGYLLSKFSKLSISNDFLLPLLVGLVLVAVGISHMYHLSSLMVCIVLGFFANNIKITEGHEKPSLLLPIRHIKELIFIMFFTIAGTHFSFSYFKEGYLLIIAYVLMRGLGKYLGAYIGAKVGKSSNKKIPVFLGLTLLPQAGVAIGLVIQVVLIPEIAPMKNIIFNIILGSTVIYEIFGPLAAKYAFSKVGELETV